MDPNPVMEFGLSLGSNLGDRCHHLQEAIARITHPPHVTLLATSPIYETAPVNVPEEHEDKAFLNMVLIVESCEAPMSFLDACKDIERAMGRATGTGRNAPRPIDIDMLYAGDQVVTSPALTLPHPRGSERRFVLQPLADVRGSLILPGSTLTINETLEALPPGQEITRWS